MCGFGGWMERMTSCWAGCQPHAWAPFWRVLHLLSGGPRGADVCGEPQSPPSLPGLREWVPLREPEAAALCLLPAAAREAELTVLTDSSGQGAASDQQVLREWFYLLCTSLWRVRGAACLSRL